MQPTARDRIKVNNELKKLGFGGHDDPNLVSQLAFCIRTETFFRSFLMAVEPEKRAMAYRALKPHIVHFTPKPLEEYEREVKEKAEHEQWPTWDGTPFPKPFKVQNIVTLEKKAEKAIARGVLTISCHTCLLEMQFPGANRNDGLWEAYKAGWRWRDDRSYCPLHVPEEVKLLIDRIQ